MRRLAFVASLLAVLAASGCVTETSHGPCVGMDSADRQPGLVYKVSTWNAIMAVVFIETIVVPLVVVTGELYCPVARAGGTP